MFLQLGWSLDYTRVQLPVAQSSLLYPCLLPNPLRVVHGIVAALLWSFMAAFLHPRIRYKTGGAASKDVPGRCLHHSRPHTLLNYLRDGGGFLFEEKTRPRSGLPRHCGSAQICVSTICHCGSLNHCGKHLFLRMAPCRVYLALQIV